MAENWRVGENMEAKKPPFEKLELRPESEEKFSLVLNGKIVLRGITRDQILDVISRAEKGEYNVS